MCQQGQAEIAHCVRSELEELYQRYEAYERGELELSDDELEKMAVRVMMLRDAR